MFKASIHSVGQNHFTVACLEPLDYREFPLAVPSLLEGTGGLQWEGNPSHCLPPSVATAAALWHTQRLWPHFSAVSAFGFEQTQRIPALWIRTMTRLDHIVQSVAGTK